LLFLTFEILTKLTKNGSFRNYTNIKSKKSKKEAYAQRKKQKYSEN